MPSAIDSGRVPNLGGFVLAPSYASSFPRSLQAAVRSKSEGENLELHTAVVKRLYVHYLGRGCTYLCLLEDYIVLNMKGYYK